MLYIFFYSIPHDIWKAFRRLTYQLTYLYTEMLIYTHKLGQNSFFYYDLLKLI